MKKKNDDYREEIKDYAEDKISVLEKAQVFESLTFKQILTLIWLGLFNPQRLHKFYDLLQNGMSARYAYRYCYK